MASKSLDWLDPKAIDSAKALEWIAKALSKGRLQGKHRSQRLSNGFEFSQYRPYVQGDDLRLIDWKMYGKTDKYYIKQSEVERDHKLHLIFDNSKSMEYEEAGWTKLLYGKLIAACLSYMSVQQGDTFSWSSSTTNYRSVLGMQQWKSCIQAIHLLDSTSDENSFKINAEKNKTYLWLTDLYQPIEVIKSQIHSLKHQSTELILFHLLGEQEEQLSFPENSTFIDLETGKKIQLSPKAYASQYKSKFENHLRQCKDLCFATGVHYNKMYINRSVDIALKQFFDTYQSLNTK